MISFTPLPPQDPEVEITITFKAKKSELDVWRRGSRLGMQLGILANQEINHINNKLYTALDKASG